MVADIINVLSFQKNFRVQLTVGVKGTTESARQNRIRKCERKNHTCIRGVKKTEVELNDLQRNVEIYEDLSVND